MSCLALQFNRLVDLAVNPSLGTVNTVLLHSLLHVVVDQLQLSTDFVEFHGAGNAAVENAIVNSERQCTLEISGYEVEMGADEATGVNIEKRILIPNKTDRNVKVFAIKNVGANNKCPAGFPLNPMQVISVDRTQNLQTSSIHDVMAKALPEDRFFEREHPESSLKAMLDFINLSKRLDALEIGTRQLADIIRKSRCELDDRCESIGPELRSLQERIEGLEDKVDKLRCKCIEENFEENLFDAFRTKIRKELDDELEKFLSEYELFKLHNEATVSQCLEATKVFKEAVCQHLEWNKTDFTECITEIQSMMDCKLDKFFVPDLKKYLQEAIDSLDEKIDKLDFSKALAAGVAKKIFKDLNCISCGDRVIQADARNPKVMPRKSSEGPRTNCIEKIQLLKLPTRLCGGKHTVTTPKERIFKSESVKTQCH